MHEAGAALLELLLADEHGLEVGERGQDGAAHPGRELPFGRVDHVDFHCAGRERDHFLLEPFLYVSLNQHLLLNMAVPPEITIFPYKSFLMSESHLRIELKVP